MLFRNPEIRVTHEKGVVIFQRLRLHILNLHSQLEQLVLEVNRLLVEIVEFLPLLGKGRVVLSSVDVGQKVAEFGLEQLRSVLVHLNN